jgi:hypothetical protein
VVSSSRSEQFPRARTDDPEAATFLFFFILRPGAAENGRVQRFGGGNDSPRSHDPVRGDGLGMVHRASGELA